MVIYTTANLNLLLKLTEYVNNGVELYLGNEPATPEGIVNVISVCEGDEDYMPDYMDNEDGHLFRIRYDRVRAK